MANGQNDHGGSPAWLIPALGGFFSMAGAWFRSRRSSEDPVQKKGSCLEALERISALEGANAERREWEARTDERLAEIDSHILQVALARHPSEPPK